MGKHALIIFFILCSFGFVLPAFGQNNIKKNASIAYTLGPPTFTPTLASSTEVAIDSSTGKIYQWHRATSAWLQLGQGIDVISGSTPPAYTPARNQSLFAINGVDSLYHYRSGAWRHLNAGVGGATVDGHVVMEGNTPRAQRDSLEFRSNSVIAFSATNNSTRTIIEGTIQAGGVGAAEIAADAVGNSELAANAVDSTNVVNGGLSVLDLGQHGASSGHVLKWNGAQWAPGPVVVPDGDKGDVDVTSSGTVWTVDTSAITTVKIAANAVDSTKIVNGGVSVLDLGQHGAISGNVLKWNGTQWAPGTDNNSGGTVTGSGTATYIAYWNGASSLTGEADLTYDASANSILLGGTDIRANSITPASTFTLGGNSNGINIGGSSGQVTISSSSTAATGSVILNTGSVSTSVERIAVALTRSMTSSSGTNTMTGFKITSGFGNTGGSTAITRSLWIVPSALTTVADYRGLDLDFNDANARGVYQSGALVKNYFAGATAIGSTSAPVRTLDVTGEVRISDLTTDAATGIVGTDADGDLSRLKVGNNLTVSNDTLHANLSGYVDGSGGAGQVAYFSDANTITSEAALNYDAANNRLGLNKSSPAVTLDIQQASASDGVRIQTDGTADQDVWGLQMAGTAIGSYVQRGRIGMDIYSASGSLPDGHSMNFVLSRDGGSTYTPLALYNNQALFNRSGSFTLANNTAELRLAPNLYDQIRMYHTVLVLGSSHGTLDTTSRLRVVGRTLTSATYSATFRDQGNSLVLAVRDDKRVGINTSTIDAALTVVALGATSSTYGLIVTPSGGTTSTASLVVRDDNRVGIRTNAPQAPLNVVGTGTTSGTTALLVEGSGGQDNLNVRDDGVNIGQGFAMASSAPTIAFGTAAGTGPANDLCSGGANGFLLAFTTGTAPATDAAIFTATLPKSYPNGVVATWSCGDKDCLDEAPDIYISGTGNNSVTVSTRSTLTASTAYLIYVTCFGY